MRFIVRIITRYFLNKTTGKLKYQNFYTLLHNISLRGMNYENTSHETDGELCVGKIIADSLINSPEIVIFDIGANVGDYAIALSNIFNSNSKIYSFEPLGSTYTTLVKNTSHINNIIPTNCGLSNKEGNMNLFFDQSNSFLSSVYKRDLSMVNIELNNSELAEFTTVDIFCNNNNIKNIDIMKVDVEGHEVNVLQGAKEMINQNKIKAIQFEFGEACIDSNTYLKDFYNQLSNYNFYRIVTDGLYPLGDYTTDLEILKTVNLIAINKEFKELLSVI